MLDAEYIAAAERRARRFSGAYTGTSGTLAADVIRLLADRRELMESLEEANRSIREAVEARLASTPKDDPKLIGLTPLRDPEQPVPVEAHRLAVVAFAGRVNSGKTAAAAMIPGAIAIQWADPLYRGLSAMLDVPEEVLRNRELKESELNFCGIKAVPREMLRTLGTEWGRAMVNPDLWVSLTMSRIGRLSETTSCRSFAICGTRFRNEVVAVRAAGGEVWWIDRPGTVRGEHVSDNSIGPDDCDAVIVNDGTLDTLRDRVLAAWQDFRSSLLTLA
jgi:hypothetical protein